MRKIQFNDKSNNLVTFASRWRKELVPEQVDRGKSISKMVARNKNAATRAKNSNTPLIFDQTSKTRDYIEKVKPQGERSRKLNNINKYDTDPLTTKSEDSRQTTKPNGKKGISGRGKEKLETLRKAAAKRKSILGKVSKFVGKNKTLVGLASTGVLGVAGAKLIRKLRSDKGKKRGRYFNGR